MLLSKTAIFAFALALMAPTLGLAESDPQAQKAESETGAEGAKKAAPPKPSLQLLYVAPDLGKPVKPTGGATRGSNKKVPLMFALTPDHVGQTVSAQPSLFWYLDRIPDASMQIEFALFDQESDEPAVETKLTVPTKVGIQRVRLADYGAELTPGSEYEWSVTLIVDPAKRSKDVVVTGWIDRIEHSDELSERIEAEGKAQSAAIYASEGIWYDSFAALNDQIDGNPGDAGLLTQRIDVLRQVGLDQVASDASH